MTLKWPSAWPWPRTYCISYTSRCVPYITDVGAVVTRRTCETHVRSNNVSVSRHSAVNRINEHPSSVRPVRANLLSKWLIESSHYFTHSKNCSLSLSLSLSLSVCLRVFLSWRSAANRSNSMTKWDLSTSSQRRCAGFGRVLWRTHIRRNVKNRVIFVAERLKKCGSA